VHFVVRFALRSFTHPCRMRQDDMVATVDAEGAVTGGNLDQHDVDSLRGHGKYPQPLTAGPSMGYFSTSSTG